MNKQEVIEWLEGWLDDDCDALEVPEEFTPEIVEAILDLLRAQEEVEKNEPQVHGQWIKDKSGLYTAQSAEKNTHG